MTSPRRSIGRHMRLDRRLGKGVEFFIAHGPARCADDPRAWRNLSLQVAMEERRQKLALRKVARGPEDHKVEASPRE